MRRHGPAVSWALARCGLALRFVQARRHVDSAERALAAARRVMRAKRYCLLVTEEGEQGPDARVVQPFPPEADMRVHLGTGAGSRKARQVAASGRAVLVYQRDRDRACVVAHCTARLLDDRESRHRYFMPFWRAFWPAGPDDDFVVIRCDPEVVEVWDARRAVTPLPFGLRSARLARRGSRWTLTD